MKRERVDRIVVDRGLCASREKARRLILAGEVLVDEVPVDKPGTLVPSQAAVRLRTPPKPYVGRGGEKLEGALNAFASLLDVTGVAALDVGASTGGFTDCLLTRGARAVTALDVGKGQLDWKLYSDERVTVVEETNARYLAASDFEAPFDLVTIDVSFISLAKVLPAVSAVVRPGGHVLMLVKPQFELGPEHVERGGLVKDEKRHLQAVSGVAARSRELGLAVVAAVPSPIKGMKGNQEFFLLARRGGESGLDPEADIGDREIEARIRTGAARPSPATSTRKDRP